MPAGRPPIPNEIKRLTGRTPTTDTGGRPLPDLANVVALPPAERMPEYPSGIGADGAELWRLAWDEAVAWLSPATDMVAVERACRLRDDLAVARARYHATTDPKDAKVVALLSKELGIALSELGFTPTSRTKLGVAEVQRASKLDQLKARRERRARVAAEVVDADIAE